MGDRERIPMDPADAEVLAPHFLEFQRAKRRLSHALARLYGEGAELVVEDGQAHVLLPDEGDDG